MRRPKNSNNPPAEAQTPTKNSSSRQRRRRPSNPPSSQPPPSSKVKSSPDPSARPSLPAQILSALQDQPLDKIELSKRLNLPPSLRKKLRDVLAQMENAGDIARIRKDRYVIPKEADLFTGSIQFHASGAAHILAEQPGEADLFISAENTWTAMHGDRVVARIATDRRPKSLDGSSTRSGAARREGRVIRILKRENETVVGTLQKSKNFFYVIADDPRFVHNLYVPEPPASMGAKIGDKVVAKLEDWPSRHVNPEGRVTEVLGKTGDPGVDILSIIRKYRLPVEFPAEVLAEAQSVEPEVSASEVRNRNDLRDRFIITIDPDDAKDFDDAIEVQRTGTGWTVAVHIADVSHYVQPKSALDREALARGNSCYLADRVIPMLPESLSNGICSLKPGVERLVFSVFAEISKNGNVGKVRFSKSLIKSAARLTYKEAFAILQKPPTDEVSRRIHTAWEVSSLLRKKRFANGSLELDFPEVKVWLDETGRPVRLERVENDISHQLIEELMLLANECVARELKLAKQPAIYRIHEKPDPEKLAEYREVVMSFGLKPGDLTRRDDLNKLLASVKGRPYEGAVKIGLLKSLKRASYATNPIGHFGLNKTDYAHFTSPIRRYADLIVHRSLERHLGLTKSGPSSAGLGTTAEHISATERVAADAERESTKLKKLEFFQLQTESRTGEAFEAQILEVRNYGLLVELPEFLLSGLVHVSALDNDFYIHDAARSRFVGRKSKRVFEAGQTIEVLVARVDMFKQQVDFKIV